jgi:hypothetical protein
MDLFTQKGAHFSPFRKYRYSLWRGWDPTKDPIAFIGLNPSTANEDSDDPTIRRIINFANDWGYGGVCMFNLFALVTPNPKDLLLSIDPIGRNDEYLKWLISLKYKVVFAWGSFPQAKERASKVLSMFDEKWCMGLNNDGSPKHPLYLPKNTELIPYQS